MEIVYDEASLARYVGHAMEVSPGKPVLIDKFLESAIEVDVDCLSDGTRCIISHGQESYRYAAGNSIAITQRILSL